jgi:hypothetical protein
VKRRHAQKIVTSVVDHIPRTMVWHVIECRCGWSTALHTEKSAALRAYDNHRKRESKRAA